MNAWIWAPALLPLGFGLLNAVSWRVPRPASKGRRRISALIPARNEEATLRRCVEALLAEDVDEVIVCDDHSTDGTAQVLEALCADTRVKGIKGRPLPSGWVGKPHACAQLGEAATGDILLFVDADTVLLPGGISRILGGLADADLLSVFPRQQTETLGEKLILPMLHLTYVSWFPLALVRRSRNPKFVAANGQVLAVTRAAYARTGGFFSVVQEVVDDMAMVRHAKTSGEKVDFIDGTEIASCRMYSSGAEAWAGFSKNLFEGIGGSFPLLMAVVAIYLACFVLPWVALAWFPAAGAVGVLANVLLRVLISVKFRQSWTAILLHPVSIALFVGIALNSWRWSSLGQIRWRDRVYVSRAARGPR